MPTVDRETLMFDGGEVVDCNRIRLLEARLSEIAGLAEKWRHVENRGSEYLQGYVDGLAHCADKLESLCKFA